MLVALETGHSLAQMPAAVLSKVKSFHTDTKRFLSAAQQSAVGYRDNSLTRVEITPVILHTTVYVRV